jgi:DNA-binding NarL/FixJ family response regulator
MFDSPLEAILSSNGSEPPTRALSPLPVSQHRWVAAVSTFSTLRRDSRAILEQIRRSMNEMRVLRSRLVEGGGRPSGNGASGTELPRAAHVQLEYGLTTREVEVAMLLAEGRSNEDVAAALRVSSHTARHHTQHVLAKLGVHSRAQAGAKIRDWSAC